MHFFPASGFDQSATTPVLLGVIISWLFTETFGWVFAGLVVPGYLAALFVIHPRSGAIDVAEAILTYGIARLLGEHLARTGLTSRVFGRERFLLVLLVSVAVRLGVEAVALPRMFGYARWAFSTGLVVVPLAANACWKTGLRRGLVQNGVPTVIVYLLLRYVLLPNTNLSLAGFHLATENVAASFLASPRAYLVLLTGASLAAIANVRYGWDYNGILIPALLALVVWNPQRLAATVLEVLVLLAVVAVLSRTTALGRWNIEGPRRPTLFFALDYALRFTFAASIGRRLPGADVVDLMGFGYLVPTLLAVKISQRGIAQLVLLPTLTVAGATVVLSTLLGFAAQKLDDPDPLAREPVTRTMALAPEEPSLAALWLAGLARPSAPRSLVEGAIDSSRLLPRLLDALSRNGSAELPPYLTTQRIQHGLLLVRERFQSLEARVGDPAVMLAPGAPTAGRVVLLVPAPLQSPEAAFVSGQLLESGLADALVIAGVDEPKGARERESAAELAARGLADRFSGLTRERGWVITLRAGADAGATTSGPTVRDARIAPLLERLQASLRQPEHLLADNTNPDARAAAVSSSAWQLPEQSAAATIAPSALELRLAFMQGRVSQETPLEDLLVLRRFVLDPLLSQAAPLQRKPLTELAARALGYELLGPSPSGSGEPAMALVAGNRPQPLALLVRARQGRRSVIEAPRGQAQALRQLALQLGEALRANVVILGSPSEPGPHADEAVRQARAAATADRSLVPTRVVRVRQREPMAGGERANSLSIAAWGDGSEVSAALKALGFESTTTALALADRETAALELAAVESFVTVDAPQDALHARPGFRQLPHVLADLPVTEGTCDDVALRLADSLPESRRDTSADLLELAQRAMAERSIVAGRALLGTLSDGAARGSICRSLAGTFLVVVGRTRQDLFLGVFPSPVVNASGRPMPLAAATPAACAATLVRGGSCRVREQP